MPDTPVVLTVGGAPLDLLIRARADAPLAHLIRALAGGDVAAGTTLLVDGRKVASGAVVADAAIVPGSTLELCAGDPIVARDDGAVVELCAVGGLRSGEAIPLGAGHHLVGREAEVGLTDPTISARHLSLDVGGAGTVTIDDAGSTNGTRVDGRFITTPATVAAGSLIEVGAVQLRVRARKTRMARRVAGPFNRPPRTRSLDAPQPLQGPREPVVTPRRSRFSWTALTLPLITGAVMALVWDPRMAAFALFSPVMVLGNWFEERRRTKGETRDGRTTLAADLERFRTELAAACDSEARRRNAVAPDLDVVVRRATTSDARLWQRRTTDDDAFTVRLGIGDERWHPSVETEHGLANEAVDALRTASLVRAPITIDLSPGDALGIVGDREAAVALARAIVAQLAVHLGPADLRVAVITEPERVSAWSFAKWLPHAEAGGARLLATSTEPDDVRAVAAALAAVAGARVVVADAPNLVTGRGAPLRNLLPDLTTIVLVEDAEALPAACTHIVRLDGHHGTAQLVETHTGRVVDAFLANGVATGAADRLARALTGVDDPDAADGGAALPASVHLADIVGHDVQWDSPDLRAVIGVTEHGPLTLDLSVDGPHGLLGGTTGAGKSELLRTLITSLAMTTSPQHLNIVLVDYKGGSAFDACARLPHTVGLVTDLDEHLGQRALQCLEAELRYRERLLRDAGAIDLTHYSELRPSTPVPRLLVVIDEFATVAAALPDFIDSLVGVAQRGRSLGVHLLLATQRPAGAVKDNIRANTNLRIALRMQDAADSTDVLGVTDAATIARRQPGRGFVRLGPGEVIAFQAALVSRRAASQGPAVSVRPYPFAPGLEGDTCASDGPTDLERMADAAGAAWDRLGLPAPRRPWPEPLPTKVDLDSLRVEPRAFEAALGLADDPTHQRQVPHAWQPRVQGNLLVYGAIGSGTTTALNTIALSLARTTSAESLHLYAMDFGAGGLASLGELPHAGAVIGAIEIERQRRLVRMLRAELDRRRAGAPGVPTVLLLDGWSGFASAFDDIDGMEVRDQLARVIADGPAVEMWTVIAADHPNAVPLSIAGLISERLVLRLADRHDYSAFGLRQDEIPPAIAGRGIDVVSRREVQVASATSAASANLGSLTGGTRSAPPVAILPTEVARSSVVACGGVDGDRWDIAIGLADAALSPAFLRMHPADHAVVSGPARSGRSTALATIASSALHRSGVEVTVIALRPSLLRDSPVHRVVTSVGELDGLDLGDGSAHLVLVDDAEAVADGAGALARLLGFHRPDVHVIAAGRADALRASYGHWTRDLRRSRLGIALMPQQEDGDLFGAPFGRRALPAASVPGRGLLVVDGVAEIVQVAR